MPESSETLPRWFAPTGSFAFTVDSCMYILTIVENTRFLKRLAPSARHRQIVPGHPTVQVEALALAKFTSEPMKKYFAGM
jgi:hypothetical protein